MSIKKDYLHTVEYHPACLEDSDQFFPLCCIQGQPHGLAYDVFLLLAKLPVGQAAHEQVWKEHEEIWAQIRIKWNEAHLSWKLYVWAMSSLFIFLKRKLKLKLSGSKLDTTLSAS